MYNKDLQISLYQKEGVTLMEWTLISLFVVSVLLLIFSILKTNHATKVEHKQIDLAHISTMKEINAIQESIRNMELDMEVVMKEAGVQLSSNEKLFTREVLDLYKRNYSVDSIAEMKQVTISEIEQLLIPYQHLKDEGRKVANEN
ncbi:competence protein ComGC [Bacillus sp. SLBN-46]|nr:competence protein ComGC [Bacillus sp. SLBN-46]